MSYDMLVWNNQCETGHPLIDEQHREIFQRLNDIGRAIERRAGQEELSSLITVLLDYAHRHFRHEEHEMKCSRCPFHEVNCAAHQKFITRLQIWLTIVNSGTMPVSLITDIHAETCRWIQEHIASIDVGLREVRSAPPIPLSA